MLCSILAHPVAGRALTLLSLALAGGPLPAQDSAADLALRVVADGLVTPVDVVADPGDPDLLLVAEKTTGLVRSVDGHDVSTVPVLDLSAKISSGVERGLLALELHPEYARNGRFYVTYTDAAGDSVIDEHLMVSFDPPLARQEPTRTLLRVPQPAPVHNVCDLAFGPDGYLYVATGDGGPGGDPFGAARDPFVLRGKLLRLDVHAIGTVAAPGNAFVRPGAGRPEIWAMGLRNPWRMSFDGATGDLWVADVGQGTHEEIDFLPLGTPAGADFGWSCVEGGHCTGKPDCDCTSASLVAPLHYYPHQDGDCAVIGGHVYRGPALPEFYGAYIFADWCSKRIRVLRRLPAGGVAVYDIDQRIKVEGQLKSITSFALDRSGELLVVDRARGAILRLEPL